MVGAVLKLITSYIIHKILKYIGWYAWSSQFQSVCQVVSIFVSLKYTEISIAEHVSMY